MHSIAIEHLKINTSDNSMGVFVAHIDFGFLPKNTKLGDGKLNKVHLIFFFQISEVQRMPLIISAFENICLMNQDSPKTKMFSPVSSCLLPELSREERDKLRSYFHGSEIKHIDKLMVPLSHEEKESIRLCPTQIKRQIFDFVKNKKRFMEIDSWIFISGILLLLMVSLHFTIYF
jgi:hypothetical protein